MFKALVAASLAMLACCAAAALAGPVQPVTDLDGAGPRNASESDPSPLHVVIAAPPCERVGSPASASAIIDGFVPISLSSTRDGAMPAAPGDAALPGAAPVQPAVIPLPTPLYAALALLAIALIARRAAVRAY